MTWNSHHRRGDTLRSVLSLLDQRRDGVLPLDAPGVPADLAEDVARNFADDLDLLGALLLRWHARLSGALERTLAAQPDDLPEAVAAAWRTTAEQMPGLRLVVDRAAREGTPEVQEAMARARRLEHARLALAAGLASTPGAAAAAVGCELEQRARQGLRLDLPVTDPYRSRPARPTPTTKEVPVDRHPRSEEQRPTAPVEQPLSQAERDEANASFVARLKAALAAA
jgi:hypothetical protein